MSKKTHSSFPEQQILQEGWRDFLKGGTKGAWARGDGKQDDQTILDPVPPDPTPTPPKPAPKSADTGIPISGTEYQVMEFVAGAKILEIIKDAISKTLGKGKWREDPQQKSMASNFMRVFIPSFMKAAKNPNIDIAENTQIAEFMLEYLTEAGQADTVREPLSTGTVSSKKGKQRAKMGMQGYLKPLGAGKPPVLANQISRALEAALTKNADQFTIDAAVQQVAAGIKDEKRKNQYIKQQKAIFAKNPEERVRQYKENVAALIQSVVTLASSAAASALSTAAAEAPSAEIQKAIQLLKKNDVAGAMEILGGANRSPDFRKISPEEERFLRDRPSAAPAVAENTIKITSEGKVERIKNEKK